MRADALRDNTAWRRLVADVVRRGIELGTFSDRYAPDTVAVLAVAAADGMGIPLSLGDPEITAAARSRTCWPRCANCSARAVPVADFRQTGSLGQRNLCGRGRVQVTVSCEGG